MSADLVAIATITIAAPSKRVWAALTTPQLIEKYYFGTHAESDWQQGSAITWRGEYDGSEYLDHGTILEAVPNRLLAHTHFSPLSGVEDVPENYHTLTWRLEDNDGSTTVILTQDNNGSYDDVKHSEENWRTILEGLKRVVES